MPLEVAHLRVLGCTGRVEAWTQHQRPRESAEAGGDVHWSRAGKIVDAEIVEPAAGVPLPVGEDVVHERGPAEQEEHGWEETSALKHSTSQDHSGGRHESEAESRVQDIWDICVGE